MTPFTVNWLDDPEQELALLWLNAPDKAAVTAADAIIQRLLAADPLKDGVELSEGLYKLWVPPLAVFYSVDTAQRVVEVSWVVYAP